MTTKKTFGRFVAAKRQAAGLTQRGLADQVFVSESAVSKWERGLSYPDISLVGSLAAALGVSEGELVKASDDPVDERVERDARVYRRWRTSIRWTTLVAYALALVACFVVNLAVDRTLSWFWVVLTAVAVAASLTTLPLSLPARHRPWLVLGAFVVSLFSLFVVVWARHGGGSWVPMAMAGVLFAGVVALGPVVLRSVVLPSRYSRHRAVIALGADTVALVGLLLVVASATGVLDQWWGRIVPIAGLSLLFPWVVVLVLRYLPLDGLYRAAIAVGFLGVYQLVIHTPIERLSDGSGPRPVDLTRWDEPFVSGNVSLLVMLGCLVVAASLAVGAALRARPH